MRLVLKLLLTALAINTFALATSARAATQKDCDEKQEQWFQQPEPKDWGSLYNLFKRFGDCDDGAMAEGFSEDVAKLFSKQWTHLNALSRLTVADKRFERFVLRHVDATLSDDELKAIADNSRLRCPTREDRLCNLVRARAQLSLDELNKALK